ncbi:glycine cleavage system protein GcvH [Aestuariibius insulae]|uniref:glycine cleavage system protein GcvH n=1 Tax=Aestuariibius insulae TaxID=2058287 RepID=UPI00345E2BD0
MKYTEEHEWLRVDGDIVVVGITEHAATQLGDIVFVELPDTGTEVEKDGEAVVIESVKAASDILSPLAGEIVEVNEALSENPALANEDPTGQGWFFKIKAADLSPMDGYMDEAAYKAMID